MTHSSIIELAKPIKLLVLDVDGVMTDGYLYFTNDLVEIKAFHSQDGIGLKLLKNIGVEIAVITARSSHIVKHRMESLNVDLIYQGHHDKIPVYEEMKSMFHLKNEEIAYMGDDITDLPLIRRSGLGVAPSNAHNFVKQHANYVTEKSGGHGAVRELCDLILSSKGLFDKIYSQYL